VTNAQALVPDPGEPPSTDSPPDGCPPLLPPDGFPPLLPPDGFPPLLPLDELPPLLPLDPPSLEPMSSVWPPHADKAGAVTAARDKTTAMRFFIGRFFRVDAVRTTCEAGWRGTTRGRGKDPGASRAERGRTTSLRKQGRACPRTRALLMPWKHRNDTPRWRGDVDAYVICNSAHGHGAEARIALDGGHAGSTDRHSAVVARRRVVRRGSRGGGSAASRQQPAEGSREKTRREPLPIAAGWPLLAGSVVSGRRREGLPSRRGGGAQKAFRLT
jgi:hypothetical protein